MALNAKTKKRWWLWTPNRISDDGSERQTPNWGCDSECRSENRWWLWTPRPKSDDSERQNWKMMMMTLNVDLKTDNGSERRNLKIQWWLWMPKLRTMMALNAKLGMMMALNAKSNKWWWLWMPNWEWWWLWTPKLRSDKGSERRNWECECWLGIPNGDREWWEEIRPSVACHHNSRSIGRV